MASAYATRIEDVLSRHLLSGAGTAAFRPEHIEAYMRLDHPTLDGLSDEQFTDEVLLAATCVLDGGTEDADSLARSFGLILNKDR